jgi:hypothetical protein
MTTVHVPAEMPFSVNVVPDGCEPCGEAVQIPLLACCIVTGTDAGVPIGTLPGFVSAAWAVKESVPPTLIVGDATETLTWYRGPAFGAGVGVQPLGIALKFGGQLGDDDGAVGSAAGVHDAAHGVGSGAMVAAGQIVSVAGPVAASGVRQGIKRSAAPPFTWMTKWNAPLAGQPISVDPVFAPMR